MAMKIVTGRNAGAKGESSYTLNRRIFTDVNCTKIVDASEKPKSILGDKGSKIPLSIARMLGLAGKAAPKKKAAKKKTKKKAAGKKKNTKPAEDKGSTPEENK